MLVHKLKLYFCLCVHDEGKHQRMEEDIRVTRKTSHCVTMKNMLDLILEGFKKKEKKESCSCFPASFENVVYGASVVLFFFFFLTWNSAKAVNMAKAITDYYYFLK